MRLKKASVLPRVVEEIKWRPPETSNISIIDRFDDFIEEPVEEIVRQLRAEGDIERRSRATSTPNPKDAFALRQITLLASIYLATSRVFMKR